MGEPGAAEALAGRRVLLTGASGFLGSHLAKRLVQIGAEVHAVIRPSSSERRLAGILERIQVCHGDLTDAASVTRWYETAAPELVLHFAGDTAGRRFDGRWEDLDRSLAVNLHGTLNLLRAALESGRPISRFVRAGGLEEYGTAPVPFDEVEREQPVSPYSASQVAATHYAQMLQQLAPFAIVTLRPALVYGPDQSLDFFIPALIASCLRDLDFPMTAGSQRRDLLYVDDLVEAVLLAAVRPGLSGAIINVGHGVEHEILAVAEAIIELTGSSARLRVGTAPARARDLEHLVPRTDRAQALLGWRPRVELREGLRRTITWYRQQDGSGPAGAAYSWQ